MPLRSTVSRFELWSRVAQSSVLGLSRKLQAGTGKWEKMQPTRSFDFFFADSFEFAFGGRYDTLLLFNEYQSAWEFYPLVKAFSCRVKMISRQTNLVLASLVTISKFVTVHSFSVSCQFSSR